MFPNRQRKIALRLILQLLITCALCASTYAASPLNFLKNLTESEFSGEQGSTIKIKQVSGESHILVDYPASKHPGLDFTPLTPLDLSAYDSVEATLTNLGETTTTFTVRVDNDGDWSMKPHPYNAEVVTLAPDETSTVSVNFGVTFNKRGFNLDSSAVTKILIIANNPSGPGGFELKELSATAADSHSSTGPTPYPDKHDNGAWPGVGPIRVFKWMPVNRDYFWTQRQADQGKVVLVGDSQIAGWQPYFKQYFKKDEIALRGIGGDTSRGLLFRFQEDVMDLNPKGVVILIGGNDLSAHASPKDIISNISSIIEIARKQNLDLPIILCQGLPKDNPKAPLQPGAKAELNRRIAELGNQLENVVVLDLYSPFTTENDTLILSYFKPDMTHLSSDGYKRFYDVLMPEMSRMKMSE